MPMHFGSFENRCLEPAEAIFLNMPFFFCLNVLNSAKTAYPEG